MNEDNVETATKMKVVNNLTGNEVYNSKRRKRRGSLSGQPPTPAWESEMPYTIYETKLER